MRRPGPLKDLPLERFLLSNPNLPTKSPFKSNKKRAFESPALFSPAKRRILNEEVAFKGSASTPRTRSSTCLADAMHGQGSAARKLDFGPPKSHAESSNTAESRHRASSSARETPQREVPTKLRPSPELAPRPIPTISLNDEMDDFFSSPHPISRSILCATMTPIPRTLLHPHDRHSAHYPGFDIHQDTHVIMPQPQPGSPAESEPETEKEKENVAPRRKARHAATAPTTSNLKSALLSPETRSREIQGVGRAHSTPATPKKSLLSLSALCAGAHSPTPRRNLYVGRGTTDLSPGMPSVIREDMPRGKRILAEEVDNIGGDEDD